MNTKQREKPRAFSRLDQKLVEGFHPAFFGTVMGTGICANLLSNFPYGAEWLKVCSYIMFGIAIVLFVSLSILMVLACVRDRSKIVAFNTDISISVYMGCYAMGFTTLVNYLYFLVKDLHHGPIAVFVLWWIAVLLSLYTACITFFFSYVAKVPTKAFTLEDLHITLLMPVVTLTVAGSSGNLFLLSLPTVSLKVLTLVTTFLLWANALIVAFIIITLYFYKLLVHKIPNTGMVFSSFLPVGFLGQAAYCIIQFGKNCHVLVTETGVSSHYFLYLTQNELSSQIVTASVIGNSVLIPTALTGLVCITFGYFMTFLSVASVLSKIAPFAANPNPSHTKHGFIKFSRSFWSMTFPFGSLALGNIEFYRVFGDGFVFFRAIAATYATAVLVITVVCLLGMVYRFFEILFHNSKDTESDESI